MCEGSGLLVSEATLLAGEVVLTPSPPVCDGVVDVEIPDDGCLF